MMMCLRWLCVCLVGLLLIAASHGAQAQTGQFLLSDEFDNAATFDPNNPNRLWDTVTYGYGRTKFGTLPTLATENGTTFARLKLQSVNPDPVSRAQFPVAGTEIHSRLFALERGKEFEARIRGKDLARGIVTAFWSYANHGTQSEPSQSGYSSDEIDFEFLSNRARNTLSCVTWSDWRSALGYNDGVHHREWAGTLSGLNTADWNILKIRWLPDRVEWWVNGALAHTSTEAHPDGAMSVELNIWAPAWDWSDAYDGALTATNASYYLDVDYVRVSDIAAPVTVAVSSPTDNYSYTRLTTITGTSGGTNAVQSVSGRLYSLQSGQFWNGTSWALTATEVAASGTGSWSFALPSLPDGKYEFRATARDASGNTAASTLSFFIDTTAPTIAITSPAANAILPRLTTATGTANDGIGPGVANVSARLQRTQDGLWWNGSTWSSTGADLPVSGTANWSLSLPTLPNGRYLLRVSARDYVGNTRTSPDTFFSMDATAPLLSVTSPIVNGFYAQLASATGTASDGESGLQRVSARLQRQAGGYFWNGSIWVATATDLPATLTANTTGGFNWSWPMPPASNWPEGVYKLTAYAYDRAGNINSRAVPFNLARTPIAISISRPLSGTRFTSLASASGTSADNGFGVKQVRGKLQRASDSFFWNGSAWQAGTVETIASGAESWTWNMPPSSSLPVGAYTFTARVIGNSGRTFARSVTFNIDAPAGTTSLAATSAGATSRVAFSSGSVAGEQVRLNWSGSLDASTANAAHFQIWVNGALVVPQSVAVKSASVLLILPAGSVLSGARLDVSWSGLRDAQGAITADGVWRGLAS